MFNPSPPKPLTPARLESNFLSVKFTGFEIGEEDLGDAMGELTNILAGRVQYLLDEQGLKADITLPSVYSVQNLRVLIQRKNTHDYFHFDAELGKMWVGITVGISQGLIL